MLTTWLTDRFGVSVPVVSAPMAGVAGGALARAVSSAGALGMIGYAGHDLDALQTELSVAAEGGHPFGVGFLAWTFEQGDEALLDAATDAGAALVAVSYGNYAPHVERIHDGGAAVATQVGTLDDARRAVDAGVDVLVARGGEGGGHGRDAVATLPLLQAVLDDVDLPVLAAGGIATARGLAAVLAAGAAGAWVGTAFIACDESAYDEARRQGAVEAGLDSTVYTTVFDIGRGSPWPSEFGGRAVRNSFSDTWYGRDEELLADPVRSAEPVLWAGQAVGLVHARRPAAEVVEDLAGAEGLLAEVCRAVTRG